MCPYQRKIWKIDIKYNPIIVKLFKSSVTKQINDLRNTEACPIWQRNYYENIIKNEKRYLQIIEYIENNPIKCVEDRYYV